MNRIISDTAEYGCYLFDHACKPLLKNFMKSITKLEIGDYNSPDNLIIDQNKLKFINQKIKRHSIEVIGTKLRKAMVDMKSINCKQ